MPQIFHRSFNTISRVTIFGAVFIVAGLGWALAVFVRSSYATNIDITLASTAGSFRMRLERVKP